MAASAAHSQEPLWIGTFVSEQQSTQGVDAAIETAVAKMNFITRPIARSRLKKTNPAYERITISQNGRVINVQFDDRKPIEMPADGTSIKWKREDGEVFDVAARVIQGKLVQTFRAEDGYRVNTFSANQSGQMTMEAKIASGQLPSPVIYTLLYQRSSGTPAP
jgi:hypothetical protein